MVGMSPANVLARFPELFEVLGLEDLAETFDLSPSGQAAVVVKETLEGMVVELRLPRRHHPLNCLLKEKTHDILGRPRSSSDDRGRDPSPFTMAPQEEKSQPGPCQTVRLWLLVDR
jgi:hypothetical protein